MSESPNKLKPRIFLFDLETTGLPHSGERIVPIELAAEVLDPNVAGWPTIARYHSLLTIPTDATLQPGAMHMHRERGRNLAYFHEFGTNPGTVYEEVADFVIEHSSRVGDEDTIVKMVPAGHNAAKFDIPLLAKEMYRYGIDMDKILDYHCLDTAIMAYERFVFTDQVLEKIGLAHVCKHFGFEVDKKTQHKASYDVHLTAQVLRRMFGVV